ncbi:MAG: 3-phosphoshikimate 1-carboxyvinyltransferase [Candidatus Riflebacteria bacterium HGW-Riflebacteria-2]|jgi:3-phosphoshikimate 1-carboxyvinyltransferase|nr:MAG: 3-phosphoshikimate 1-carboxyvinyltransferase [Candidatus Riflebacteria bacterium HGW-Riflebacteria-2]
MYIAPATNISGELSFPGDKSISHRLVLLSLLNRGQIEITGISDCADVRSSLSAVKQLGIRVTQKGGVTLLQNNSTLARQGHFNIDCGNSGTTARLLAGILAGQPGFYRLFGDESLSRRPMRRIVEPLNAMNANISAGPNDSLPLEISGSRSLRAAKLSNPTGSAQVKSAIMLAALQSFGETTISEQISGRDHSERLFSRLNLPIKIDSQGVSIKGPADLSGNHSFSVPGDISSAAFFAVAASIIPGSSLLLKNVLLNPTRTGFIEVLRRMGANIVTLLTSETWEPYGNISVTSADLRATAIEADEVPFLIDELPALAVAMAFSKGKSRVTGAGELRHKETDRIRDLVSQLKLAGIKCNELIDGFEIEGGSCISRQANLDSCGDHRLAMSFAIMALGSKSGLEIKNSDCIAVSLPKFFTMLHKCTGQKN